MRFIIIIIMKITDEMFKLKKKRIKEVNACGRWSDWSLGEKKAS